jgi:hypothetical protein
LSRSKVKFEDIYIVRVRGVEGNGITAVQVGESLKAAVALANNNPVQVEMELVRVYDLHTRTTPKVKADV